jgi:hypothetical protein
VELLDPLSCTSNVFQNADTGQRTAAFTFVVRDPRRDVGLEWILGKRDVGLRMPRDEKC